MNRVLLYVLCLLIWFPTTRSLDQPALAQGDVVPIAEQARAVFKKRCVSCHSQSQVRGGLDMSSLDAIMAGSTSGAVVQPGRPDESLLYTLASHLDAPKMPPNAPKIPERELKTIAAWIATLADAEASHSPKTMAETKSDRPASSVAALDGIVEVEPVPGSLCITAIASYGSLVAVSGLHQVLLYDVESAKWVGGLRYPEGDVFALRFTRDGSRLIAAGGMGGLSGDVVCWDTASYRRTQKISIEDDVVLAMDIAADGRTLAVAGPKRIIELYDLESGNRLHVLKKHADWVSSLAFSPDGVLLASGDRFGSVYLWDVKEGSFFGAAESHARMITALEFDSAGNQLWSAGADGMVRRWDLQREKLDQRIAICEKGIADLAIVGNRIVALGNDGTVNVCRQADGQRETITAIEEVPTRCVAWNASDSKLLIGDIKSNLRWIDLSSGDSLHSLTIPQKISMEVAARSQPRAIDRSLSSVETPAEPKTMRQNADELRAAAKNALTSSREVLQRTRETLSDLERTISDLEKLIEQLDR